MNRIELVSNRLNIFQRVTPNKRKGIVLLRLDIHANDFGEPGAVVADRRPASPAEEIEEPHEPDYFVGVTLMLPVGTVTRVTFAPSMLQPLAETCTETSGEPAAMVPPP